MTSTVGQYTLGRTLGSGFSAKVKLGTDPQGAQFAVKIFRLDNPEFNQRAFQLLRDEVQSVQTLDHKHVVKYFEFNENATWNKKNGDQVQVAYIVSELVHGGELFDYVANSGPFKESIVRYYAKQLIQAIHYIHTKGFAHRDLKCENILLDKLYDVKVVDFGFACPVEGRTGDGMNRSIVGSLGFMAPEIHAKQPYQGQVVDLFALGVILFVLYAGHPPFNMANLEDPHYKLIATNRSQQFWSAHSNRKPEGFFNEEFKDLITAMLNFHPHQRLSIPDIVAHPWLQRGEFANAEEVRQEFVTRHEANKAVAQEEQDRKQAMKTHIETQPRRGDAEGQFNYRWNEDPELTEGERNDRNTVLLALKEYQEGSNRTHGFFSTIPPEEILSKLIENLKLQNQAFKVADNIWKVNFECKKQINLQPEDEDGDEEEKQEEFVPVIETAQVQFEILKVPERSDQMLFVNFKRKAGAAILFYETVKVYMDQLALYNNATLEEQQPTGMSMASTAGMSMASTAGTSMASAQ